MADPAPVDEHLEAPPAIAFAGATLDRAAHLRDDSERLRALENPRAVLVGTGQEIAVTGAGTLALAPVADLPSDAVLTFLGLDRSGGAVFAYDAAPAELASLRSLMAELDPAEAALAAYAVGMIGWHRVHRHCGRCGHATKVEQAGHRRRCPNCGLMQFPRTDPAVTMLVQNRDQCLLSRRHGAPENRWSALAGFVEPGETPEAAVVREACEETGVPIHAVEYVTSQPWPFPAALMIGFWAFVDPERETTAPTPEPSELVEARWWDRAELADAVENDRIVLPPPGTIGNYLISTWVARG
ncbi:MAG: NAD(+) diphosphatase [Solirubrobacterales bacterium]|nr:NAD(+) diphosphatase [Solirubrobacterales bacterium]